MTCPLHKKLNELEARPWEETQAILKGVLTKGVNDGYGKLKRQD